MAAVELDSRQRRRLRGLAHALAPAVQVGKGLASDELVAELARALDDHELVKVRFLAGREAKRELAAELARRTGAGLAGLVGHVAILYRRHPDPARRKVRLEEPPPPGPAAPLR